MECCKNRKGWRFIFFVTVRLLIMIFMADTVWATGVDRAKAGHAGKGRDDALKILLSMKKSYSTVESYTAILVKSDQASGGDAAPQKIFVKFKKPFKVYMKWMENAHAGREVLYVQGENNDQFFAKPDGMLGAFVKTVQLPSDYKSDGSDHTVRDVGIGRLVDTILDIAMQAKEDRSIDLACKGVVVRNGRKAYLIEKISARSAEGQHARYVLYVDKTTQLPLEAYAYDKNGKLSEFCVYKIIKLNPKIADAEFRVDNKDYGFRYL